MSQHRGISPAQKNHMEALAARHALLSRRIEQEESKPGASQAVIRQMKIEKLRLKDEIEGREKKKA